MKPRRREGYYREPRKLVQMEEYKRWQDMPKQALHWTALQREQWFASIELLECLTKWSVNDPYYYTRD